MCLQTISSVSLLTTDHNLKRRGPGHVIHFKILHALNFSGMAEDGIVKFYARLDAITLVMMINCPQVGVVKVT